MYSDKEWKKWFDFWIFFFTGENHAHPGENFQHSITPNENKYSVPVLHFTSTFAKHVSDRFKINFFQIYLLKKKI